MTFPGRECLLDILKGSVATLALFLAFVTLPLVGMLPGMFAPLPALYYSFKGNRGNGAAIVVIVAVVLSLMGDPPTVLLYLLQSGCLSIALPFFLREGKGTAKSLGFSIAICLVLFLMAVMAYSAFSGVNLDRQAAKGVQASIAQTASFYEKAGVKGDELKAMQEGLTQAGNLIAKVYPAMMVISLSMVAGLSLLALARMSARLPNLPHLGSFQSFKIPEPLVWVLIIAGFAMLVPQDMVTRVALNVLLVMVFMYFIQGLAVVAHFFRRLAVPRLIRIIFYVLLAVQPYLAIGLAVVGVFDIWGDFRTPKPRENL